MNKFRSSGIYQPLLSEISLGGISERIRFSSSLPSSIGVEALKAQPSINLRNTSVDVSYYKKNFSTNKVSERVKLVSVQPGTHVIKITGAEFHTKVIVE